MTRIKQLLFTALIILSSIGCQDKLELSDKYARPDWLAGKLYTQILTQPDLSTFAQCVVLTGYDTIINTSGSYTVFAPSNEAFTQYLQNHGYNDIHSIPLSDLTQLVKYHIVQNPWSTDQLRSLDVYGWIDSTDINNDEPRGYKRETLLREKDTKYGVKQNENKLLVIVDTLQSNWYRRQATDSRKYAPIFYKEFFEIYDLKPSDYSFYFGRTFNPQSMYFAGGEIITPNLAAENGFVHIIDQVIEPLKNAYQILETKKQDISYSKFLDLVNTFPQFDYNNTRTIAQPGADQGLAVDSLFDITYPQLAFNLSNERTKAPSGTIGLPANITIRYQHGMIAPTNQAFDAFINEYISGSNHWGSLTNAPIHIKRMIANSQLSVYDIYPSDFTRGIRTGENDLIYLDPSTVVQKEFGSNCTFIGVNKMIVPKAFEGVTGPIYLQPGYSITMFAIEKSGLLPALKKSTNKYLLYAESDQNLRSDSSLLYTINQRTLEKVYSAYVLTRQAPARGYALTTNDLRTLVLNHIGIEMPKGIARKEFIQNLAGNYIVINNETGEVSGTSPTKIGFRGQFETSVIPVQIGPDAINGKTFEISNWFNFSANNLYSIISSRYPKFQGLLLKAGLANDKEFRYIFLSENDNYTVFAPTDAALDAYNTDTLTTDELKKFLMLHFVQGELIFTDGNKPARYYETTRVDEKSTTYSTIYTKIFIDPGYDQIHILDNSGGDYIMVPESSTSNIIAGKKTGADTDIIPNAVSNGVVHEIDKVLLVNELDRQ
jgi:uncharacterized surface protein with fasciclin (FAS1) repeats